MFIPPSIEMWRALIETWRRMNHDEPWKWLDEFHLIGVEDPFTGDIGIGHFIGPEQGTVPGFELMLDSQGLAGQIALWNHPGMDPVEQMTVRSSLSASTSKRSALDRKELEAIKRLRFKFQGDWPSFRNQYLGFYPSRLDFEEARTLLFAMDQALDIAQRAKKDHDLIERWHDVERPIFTRKGMIEADRIVWEDGWWQPQPVKTEVSTLPDELIKSLREAMGKKPRGNGTWFLSCPYLLNMAAEDRHGKMRVPRVVAFIDLDGMETVMLRAFGKDMDVLMPLSLVDGLMAGKEVPRELVVSDDFSEALASDIVQRLGVEVRRVGGLPEAESAAKNAALEFERAQIEANERRSAARSKKA